MNEEHDDNHAAMRALISGYLDDELSHEEHDRLEAYVRDHPDFAREIEEMRGLVRAADVMEPEPVPDELWDTFLDDVYNRLERRTGWSLTIVGAIALLAVALYVLIVIPWAPPAVKIATEIFLLGLGILFVSVLRQRLFIIKTDRYSRDVKR